MPEQLIKNRQCVSDPWQVVTDEAASSLPTGPALVPVSIWLAQREVLIKRCQSGAEIGVSLPSSFGVEDIAGDVQWFSLIAVEFPKFADGRGYSTARLLRERYGYKKELRATGDVGKDQLFLLQRAGFDAFLIPATRDAQEALKGFNDFPETYQGATDQPLPLFRRRTG